MYPLNPSDQHILKSKNETTEWGRASANRGRAFLHVTQAKAAQRKRKACRARASQSTKARPLLQTHELGCYKKTMLKLNKLVKFPVFRAQTILFKVAQLIKLVKLVNFGSPDFIQPPRRESPDAPTTDRRSSTIRPTTHLINTATGKACARTKT